MFDGLLLLEKNFPNKNLKELINNFKKDDSEENYIKLIKEMELSIFLVPMLSKKNNINGFILNEINDEKCLSIFSNIEEFEKWNKNYDLNFFFYNINDIVKILKKEDNEYIDGLIIDPYGLNIVLTKELISKRITD